MKQIIDGIIDKGLIEKLSPENKKNYERLLSDNRKYSVSEFNRIDIPDISKLNDELYQIIENNNYGKPGD